MLCPILLFTNVFPSSGCHTRIKQYFISVRLLVCYISVNIAHCTDVEHTKSIVMFTGDLHYLRSMSTVHIIPHFFKSF